MKRYLVVTLMIITLVFTTTICLPYLQQEKVMQFANWNKFYSVTQGIIESDAHNAYVEIFTNEKAKKAYIEVLTKFKEGAKVFKPLYRDINGTQFARLVIMVKMQEGYDRDNGDWWYGVYDESGTKMAYEGRIPECIKCHSIAKETDYMFSRSVMKKLQGIDTNEYEEYEPDGEEY